MKADLFVLYALGSIAALFAYVFVGGLVARACHRLFPWVGAMDSSADEDGMFYVVFMWPIALLLFVVCSTAHAAYHLSQWRPRRKSTLPCARVVS
jgi:hypothetical protein